MERQSEKGSQGPGKPGGMSHRVKISSEKKRRVHIFLPVVGLLAAGMVVLIIFMIKMTSARFNPKEFLHEYIACISNGEYQKMYEMIDVENSESVSEEDFIKRNSAIYEGIEAENIKAEVSDDVTDERSIRYQMSFDTLAGPVSFENEMNFVKGQDGYKLAWKDNLIFPELERNDKVRVLTSQAERGEITDRNGQVLAGKSTASSVGIVPGKLKDREESVRQISELLNMDPETIENKLEAEWVKEDFFVPVAVVPKVQDLDLMQADPDEGILEERERQKKLLEIPGVMLSDTEVRSYSLKEAAAHLIGYVQEVTAEDLENYPEGDYSSGSVIGRTGMESLFEKELKGQNGHEIVIVDENGNTKETVAVSVKEDGENIWLTIDSGLQQLLYEQFKDDNGCSVAVNPYTGEVLALVSTPSYDNNDFIRGLSAEQWSLLNEDEKKPLLNRFRQVWDPDGEIWVPGIFSDNTVSQVMEGMIGVVNDPNGTGYAAHRDDILLAGKTGTAEIKATQEDTSGTETGWFTVFTTDPDMDTPVLIISMVEDVKETGGSGYVVSKVKEVLAQYIKQDFKKKEDRAR